MSDDAPPVRVRGLGKRFGRRAALEGVDLEVASGEVVALVGPNGSGKTTMLRILAGLARADSGEAHVFGLDPRRARAEVMQRARFSFAPPALFDALSAREHLTHLGAMGRRSGARPSRTEVDAALELVGLRGREDDAVGTFSFGMRQRLALATAMMPRPELIVLDEPADGLDPLAVLELRGILARLAEEHGVTVLLSSHLLLEVGALADRLTVLREGRVLLAGEPDELVRSTQRRVLVAADADSAAAELSRRGIEATRDGDALVLSESTLTLAEAADLMRNAGTELVAFHERTATLEEVVLARLAEKEVAP